MSVSESDGVSDGVESWPTLLFRLFEGPRKTFDASQLVLDLVACVTFFFFELLQQIFCKLVIFLAALPRVFGCEFRLCIGLISDARRASEEVNGEN